MRRLADFGHFWWDFVIGDDWRTAATVIAAIVVTAVLAHAGANPWWLLPPTVAVTLYASLRRATRN
jgi:hypothetical protein